MPDEFEQQEQVIEEQEAPAPEEGQEEQVDPGQLEGMQKAKNEPPPDSPRWNKVYRKMKDMERAISAMEEGTKEKDEALRLLRDQNDKLYAILQQEKSAKQQPIGPDPKDALSELKRAKRLAMEQLDWDQVSRIEEHIDSINREIVEAKIASIREEQEQKLRKAESESDAKAIIASWSRQTDWFNPASDKYDEIMAGAAREYDKKLASQPEWKGKSIEQRLSKVRKDIEDRFSYGGPKRTPPTVEGRTAPPSGDNGVKLSDEERRVARMMFSDRAVADAEKLYYNQKLEIGRQGRA